MGLKYLRYNAQNSDFYYGEQYMTVVCVDTNWIVLFGLKNKVKKILPEADVYTCRNSTDALSIAREHGCDVLITEIDFGREKEEGIRLAYQDFLSNPMRAER